jgi:hypothetical protein
VGAGQPARAAAADPTMTSRTGGFSSDARDALAHPDSRFTKSLRQMCRRCPQSLCSTRFLEPRFPNSEGTAQPGNTAGGPVPARFLSVSASEERRSWRKVAKTKSKEKLVVRKPEGEVERKMTEVSAKSSRCSEQRQMHLADYRAGLLGSQVSISLSYMGSGDTRPMVKKANLHAELERALRSIGVRDRSASPAGGEFTGLRGGTRAGGPKSYYRGNLQKPKKPEARTARASQPGQPARAANTELTTRAQRSARGRPATWRPPQMQSSQFTGTRAQVAVPERAISAGQINDIDSENTFPNPQTHTTPYCLPYFSSLFNPPSKLLRNSRIRSRSMQQLVDRKRVGSL